MTAGDHTGAVPSFWLDQLKPRSPRPALPGGREADVCIVGAGFTGLWLAYALRRADPVREVVVLEAERVGFGASGRNGGWVQGEVSGTAKAWQRRGGPGAPLAMERAMRASLPIISEAITREQIDCDWQQGGSLAVAQSPTQLARLHDELRHEREALGQDAAWRLLTAAELRQHVAVRDGLGALFTPHCARVQPAKLVAGLGDAAERAGAVIHEGTRVLDIEPGVAHADGASVRARHVILATEAYTANLPGRRRMVLPMNSSMIVTDPLPDAIWAELGWLGAETLLDGSYLYTYSQRTADGRIAIGGRGVPYRFGSRTDREGPVPGHTVVQLRERLRSLFPQLSEVPVARAWHGVLGVSRDWCPTVALSPSTGVGFAGGYAGEGVAASNLAARTMADLILGRETELTRLPWVDTLPRNWEPEPLRFIGARSVFHLYGAADRREERTGHTTRLASVAGLIAGR